MSEGDWTSGTNSACHRVHRLPRRVRGDGDSVLEHRRVLTVPRVFDLDTTRINSLQQDEIQQGFAGLPVTRWEVELIDSTTGDTVVIRGSKLQLGALGAAIQIGLEEGRRSSLGDAMMRRMVGR